MRYTVEEAITKGFQCIACDASQKAGRFIATAYQDGGFAGTYRCESCGHINSVEMAMTVEQFAQLTGLM